MSTSRARYNKLRHYFPKMQKISSQMTVILPPTGGDRSAKGCIAVRAAKGCRMRVDNVCGPAPAGGTRRHHEADEQLSVTEAQHPSQPVPTGNGIGKI